MAANDNLEIARSKGWEEKTYKTPKVRAMRDAQQIALMHSELSEALEALRHGNPPSEKAAGFSSVEEELADVVIRLMNFASKRKLDVVGAMAAKASYNTDRPYKHGGKKF